MDYLEYTSQKIVLTDKRSMETIFGFTSFFAGAFLLLITYLLSANQYLLPGIVLTLVGGAIIAFSKEKTYITFDRNAGILEIVRKRLIGAKKVEHYTLDGISKVHTVRKDTKNNSLRYRVEIELKDGLKIPLTRPLQKDPHGFETMAGRISAFLQSLD